MMKRFLPLFILIVSIITSLFFNQPIQAIDVGGGPDISPAEPGATGGSGPTLVSVEPRGIVGELNAQGEDIPLEPGLYDVLFFSYASDNKACVYFQYVDGGTPNYYSVICSEQGNPPYYGSLFEAESLPLVYQGSIAKNNIYNCNHYEDPEAIFFNDPPDNENLPVDVFVKFTYRTICFKPQSDTTAYCMNRDESEPEFETMENVENNPDFFLDKQVTIYGADSPFNLGCMHIDDVSLNFLTQETLDQIRAQDPPEPFSIQKNFSYEILVGNQINLTKSEPYLRWLGKLLARLIGKLAKHADEAEDIGNAAKKSVGEGATGEAGKASKKMKRNPDYPAPPDHCMNCNIHVRTIEEAEFLDQYMFFDKNGNRWMKNSNGGWEPEWLPSDADIFDSPLIPPGNNFRFTDGPEDISGVL